MMFYEIFHLNLGDNPGKDKRNPWSILDLKST